MSRPQPIQDLLQRMSSTDTDFRFMATNDLIQELQRDNVRWDDRNEESATRQIIYLLKDQNGEVQNLAVKCLGYLVGKIKDERRKLIIDELCKMLKDESEQIRDIASIALKTIVSEMPTSRKMLDIVNSDLNPNLLIAVSNTIDVNVQLESLDILSELIQRIGSQLVIYHERMQAELMKQLSSERSAVRKRSMNALSHLLACCSDELFNATFTQLLEALKNLSLKSTTEPEAIFLSNYVTPSKTLLQCIATIIRISGHRSNVDQLNQMMPVICSFCSIKDDELCEYCLQAFEAYVKRCPRDVGASLPDIIKICLINVTHDPNYNYDEDDEAMDLGYQGDGDDDSESAEDYSDDDDLSWKVRRASAKCLEAIIMARGDMINDFFVSLAPVLVARFKEREESVKSDIIQTFVSLLKQTRILMNDFKGGQSPVALVKLTEMIPTIVAKASGLLREKGVKTRQTAFRLFTEIMNIIPNALSEHIVSLIPGILFSFADKNSTSNMKIDALVFMQELVKTHQPHIFHPHINVILPAVITAVSDPFYKIASEALALLSQLVCVIRPFNSEPMAGYEAVLPQIYQKTLNRMSKTDLDLEIKERAMTCMGYIIANFGDKLEQQLPNALMLLQDKLNNETTRLSCVKALIKVVNSPIPMPLNHIFPKAFSTLAPFLRKNSRPLKMNTLILIENAVRKSADLIDTDSIKSGFLEDLPNLINENDLYISQLALTMLTTIIKTHKVFHPVIPQKIIPETLHLIRSPLLQGSTLQSMLQFFSTLADFPFPELDHETLLHRLVQPIYNGTAVHKQAYNSTAKAVAAISVKDQERALNTVAKLINDLQRYQNHDNVYTLILLSIGEIGRVTNLGDVNQLVDVLLHAFNSSSEDVKTAGSYALGCVAVGNMNKFLPVILHEIEARNKRQYLILHSLREVISAGHFTHLEPVWNLLMKHCECSEEGTRNVVSECLGKLTLLNPAELLVKLVSHLKNDYADKPIARSTIVAAIKFTISDQPQEIDNLLRQMIGEFLFALQDEDINVRRVALITFNSATHNKPSLILGLLPQIMPLLYQETLVKPELIREVEMGPFKHQVDDGLDSRKAAFECMYTLLDTCHNHLNRDEFLSYVENGLNDQYDIKMLTYLMLSKLANLYPIEVLQRMDRLISPIENVCRTNPKENAVKQEHEKMDELKRSALRAVDALKSIQNADRHPVLVKFFENFVKNDKAISELYASIHRDGISNEPVYKMDLN